MALPLPATRSTGKLALGSYPGISLAIARELHFKARREVAQGRSPVQSKREEKRRLSKDLQTVRGLANSYIERYLVNLASKEKERRDGFARRSSRRLATATYMKFGPLTV